MKQLSVRASLVSRGRVNCDESTSAIRRMMMGLIVASPRNSCSSISSTGGLLQAKRRSSSIGNYFNIDASSATSAPDATPNLGRVSMKKSAEGPSNITNIDAVKKWIQSLQSTLLENRVLLRNPASAISSHLQELGESISFETRTSSGVIQSSLCDELHALAVDCARSAIVARSATEVVRDCTLTFKIIEKHVTLSSSLHADRGDVDDKRAVEAAFELAVSSVVHAMLTASRFSDAHVLSDTPFFILGRVMANKEIPMTDRLWTDVMFAASFLRVANKLFDLWSEAFFDYYTAKRQANDGSGLVLLPMEAVQAMVTWGAQAGDVQRCAQLLHRSRQFGISGWDKDELSRLRIIAKVGSSARHTSLDGGLKRVTIQSIFESRVSRRTLYRDASWGVILDLMTCLSYNSAADLVRRAASERNVPPNGIPFYIWASLLRKAAKLRYVAEAESMFDGIASQFASSSLLTPDMKAELIEIMLRMYASSSPTNFPSAIGMFLDHVVHHPVSHPAVAPAAVHYQLLSRAADSRNAAGMIFLEGCASGAPFDEVIFNQLFERNPKSSVEAISKRLPHDYGSSELDSQLQIPGDVDAHLRREEALRWRGKPQVDSTGGIY